MGLVNETIPIPVCSEVGKMDFVEKMLLMETCVSRHNRSCNNYKQKLPALGDHIAIHFMDIVYG